MAGIEFNKDKKARIYVIGTGISSEFMPASYLDIIKRSGLLVGGKRLLDFFPEHNGYKVEISGDLNKVFKKIRDNSTDAADIVILASGDPLFWGIAERVIKEFESDIIEILPNISTIQQFFSRLKEPWQNVPVISLHGKKEKYHYFDIISCFRENRNTILILTDKLNSPDQIASFLQENRLEQIKMIIAEDLGTEKECISFGYPKDIVSQRFSNLNAVILKNEHPESINFLSGFGLDDNLYKHQRGLITKSEIRAIILSRLNLQKGNIFWDIGAGSGAISIEAANFVNPCDIYSVEKNPVHCEDIRENMNRFYLNNINLINDSAPECLNNLPNPDRVFIGGSDGEIYRVLDVVIKKINKNGIVVITAVLLKTFNDVLNYLEEHDLRFDAVQISIQKTEKLGKSLFFKPYNPCWFFLLNF